AIVCPAPVHRSSGAHHGAPPIGCAFALSRTENMELKVGDMVVYPAQGVSRVEGIEEKVIGDIAMRFFVLSVLDADKRIMVPENKVSDVEIRYVISEDKGDEVCDLLRYRNDLFN